SGDGAPVQFYQLLHQSQTDACAFMCTATRSFHTMEALKEARELVIRDSGARIAHLEFGGASIGGGAKRNADFAFKSKLVSIRQKIEDDFLPHVVVDIDLLRQGRAIDPEMKPGLFHCRAKGGCEVFGECGEIDRLVSSLNTTGFDAREIEQCIYQFQQP